jgi:tetratricopeptide (TPR) repeat protein
LFLKDCQLKKARVIVLLLAALPLLAPAAPHVPTDDSQVLERLPTRRDDPRFAELRQLRVKLAAAPTDAEAAAAVAHRYFTLAGEEGDPRYVGYAEAALRPWREGDAPVEVMFVRGLLRQYRHDFDRALADFDRALKQDPQHFGARSWKAAIYMVRAEYAAAARECAALPVDPQDIYAVGCTAYVLATTGHTRDGYERLSAALRRETDVVPGEKLWILTRLAEMAWRMEDPATADRLFNEALALGIDDNFLLAAYADFLLERGRAKEVVGLLKGWERSDTLLLRLALAEHKLGMREGAAHTQALADRFAAAALRAERLHMGEEARFLLDLKGDARGALSVGLENWNIGQREPRDALVVLEAAVAARDAKAAEPVLRWLRDSHFESVRLSQLAAELR